MASGDGESGKDGARGVVTPFRPARACPMCSKKSNRQWFPFCSERCKELDLGKWLDGSYAIEVVEEDAGRSGFDEE